MGNISVAILHYKDNNPKQFWSIVGAVVGIIGLWFVWSSYIDKHTPRLEIIEAKFYYEPFTGGNVTGIVIAVANQSDAWAKNVMVDFINDNGYSKYERNKYYKGENKIIEPKEIKPNSIILDGYMPQGAGGSPAIYQNNEKKYKVDIFVSWKNDRGKKYYLVAGYESLADNFNKEVMFRRTYRYDTFKDKNKVEEIKELNSLYLPDYMM